MYGKSRRPSGTCTRPRPTIAYGGRWSIPWPRNRIDPRLGRSIPEIVLIVVLLPAALAPTRATISPSSTATDIPWSTRTSPYATSMPLTSSKEVLLSQVGVHHPLVRRHLFRAALGDLLAVVEHEDPLGDGHDGRHDVLDHQEGDAAASDALERFEHVGQLRRIQPGHDLVQQQQPGLCGKR